MAMRAREAAVKDPGLLVTYLSRGARDDWTTDGCGGHER